MSPLISYRTDDEERAFRRKVAREVTRLQRNRKRRWPLWKQCLVYAFAPAFGLWLLGEVLLAVHGPMRMTEPASQPNVPHFTSTPHTGEHR